MSESERFEMFSSRCHNGRPGSAPVSSPLLTSLSICDQCDSPRSAGAEQFAASQGIAPIPEILHPEMEQEYLAWKQGSGTFAPVPNVENASASASASTSAPANPTASASASASARDHDTIGMLCRDSTGHFAAACTTSGLSFKLPGRVGDSPIVGAGLFVDGQVGSAVCTGVGEVALRTCAAFLAVELMRNGASAQEAAERVVDRMIKHPVHAAMKGDLQVGVLTLSLNGQHGAYSIRPGFTYALNATMHTATSKLS
jgi:N4-(beta-N-acetylglucosaminyl)-L-asparaginase